MSQPTVDPNAPVGELPAPGMVAQPPTNPYQMPNQVPPTLPPELMPNAWDNHEAHIFYHNQYRKSQEFEQLPDHVKQIFEIHVNMHQQALSYGVQPSGGGAVIGGQQGVMDPSQQVSDGSQDPQAQQGAM